MFSSDVIWRILFLFQICIGFMGNSLLFMLYMFIFLNQDQPTKPIDLICVHVTLLNVLAIVFRLLPHLVSSFGVRHFLDDVSCKAILFTYRVTWGLSICMTSLLSAFQAVIISPRNSKWVWLKSKISTSIYPSFLSFWILNVLIYVHLIKSVKAYHNFTLVDSDYVTHYCQTKQFEHHHLIAYTTTIIIRDFLFVVLMMWSSVYTVNLLYKHHQRSQHLHSPSLASQSSPEIKATHTILLLISCFIFYYFSDNFVAYFLFHTPEKNLRLERMTAMISSCYPTICPFVLMRNNKIVSKWTSSLLKMRIIFSWDTFNRRCYPQLPMATEESL
ncbi:vomeronasal type-1 receptor 40-like [Vicugna pacos]|uniref:Vomeronasal type-1 receptor n=1 Tax=Vicugna pacos TaxID=30538 RepID=A0ABM5DNL1_VICPA